MKALYKTPEILVEALTKSDVLCSSGLDINPNVKDNLNLDGSVSSSEANGLGGMTDII